MSLAFPKSLRGFQSMFPDDRACAAYLEKILWPQGFICPHCAWMGEPYRFAAKPQVVRCRGCRRDVALTAGTVMERTHSPLSAWFWGAYLTTTQTPGMSALQFQRQAGLKRYETAFQILHKLRAAMVRPEHDTIGQNCQHVEIDETWLGGETRGKGRGVHGMTLVAGAIEARKKAPVPNAVRAPRRGGLYAGRLRLAVLPDRTAETLTAFVRGAVQANTMVVTDGWAGYATLSDRTFQHPGYDHLPVAEKGEVEIAEQYLPLIHLIFSNLKAWLMGIHHGVSVQHLQAYLNEFTFRFNRRFYPFNAFRSLLGIGSAVESPTYDQLYSHEWAHPTQTAVGS